MSNETIWVLLANAGVLAVLLLTKLFRPSGLVIEYNAATYFEVRRLFFAAGVLAVLGFILLLSIAIYATAASKDQPAEKEIFDTVVKVVPPIITLVLGYYFGQQSVAKTTEKTNPADPQLTKDRKLEKPAQDPNPSKPQDTDKPKDT